MSQRRTAKTTPGEDDLLKMITRGERRLKNCQLQENSSKELSPISLESADNAQKTINLHIVVNKLSLEKAVINSDKFHVCSFTDNEIYRICLSFDIRKIVINFACFNSILLGAFKRVFVSTISHYHTLRHVCREGVGTPYDGLYVEAQPERGTFQAFGVRKGWDFTS